MKQITLMDPSGNTIFEGLFLLEGDNSAVEFNPPLNVRIRRLVVKEPPDVSKPDDGKE